MTEFTIGLTEDAIAELNEVPIFDRRRILAAIEQQLRHQPTNATRNRKSLTGLRPPWEGRDPTWELRIAPWRVFYDVDESVHRVDVRAIRLKRPHEVTEQIL